MRPDRKLRTEFACIAALALPIAVHAQCGPSGCYVGPATAAPQSDLPPPLREALAGVARIVHREASGVSLGSGTLVMTRGGSSYFLTCAHLFEASGRTEVRLAGRSYAARIVAIDKAHDLTLLQTRSTDAKPVTIESGEPSGLLTACGYGGTGERRCVTGPITGYSTAAGARAPSLRLRGTVRSGDSGGPVFNAAGRLVAVVWGQRGGETYAMGGGPLRRLLGRLPNARPPTRPAEPPRREVVAAEPALPRDLARQDDLRRLDSAWRERFDRLSNQINVNLSTPAASPALTRPTAPSKDSTSRADRLSYVEPLLTAVAVGGPLGVGVLVGRYWLRSRAKARFLNRWTESKPVAVDSPPPPQQVVPETRYVSYERDEFAKAHQWACEQLARKFPGAVEMLASLDSLIKQQLNGS